MENTTEFKSFVNFLKNSNYYTDKNKLSLFKEHEQYIKKLLEMKAIKKHYSFKCKCGKGNIGKYLSEEEFSSFNEDIETIQDRIEDYHKKKDVKGTKHKVLLQKIENSKSSFLINYFPAGCSNCDFVSTGSIALDYEYFTNPSVLEEKYTRNVDSGWWRNE